MNFFENTDKFHKYKYHINELYLLYPNKSVKLPSERIKSITIIHDYENNLFPIFRMELALEPSVYYNILHYKKEVQFKLRIQKFYSEIGSEEKSLYRDVINDTFDLILDDDEYDSDESLRKEANKLDYKNISVPNENDLFNKDNIIEFFLFKSINVENMKTIVNDVLCDATINDGIQYILSKSNVKKILLSPIENTNSYNELLIPPLKASDALSFLDTYYGLYKNGSIIYNDFILNIFYILSYCGKCTAYQKNEITETNIVIPDKSNHYSSDLCTLYRKTAKETNYVIGDNKNISLKNEVVSLNAYGSTSITSIDSYDGNTSTNSSTSTALNKKSEKIIENNTENIWYSDMYSSLIDGKNVVVETTLGDYDIDIISPNKKFKLIFEDTELANKYKGDYLIASISHAFIRDGNDFMLSSIIKLRQK